MYPCRDCRSSPASACGRFAWLWIHASLPTFSAPADTTQSHPQPVSDSGNDGFTEVEWLAITWCNVPSCSRDGDDQRQGQWDAHVPPPPLPPDCCHPTQAGLRPLPRWKLQNISAGQIRMFHHAVVLCTEGCRPMNLFPSLSALPAPNLAFSRRPVRSKGDFTCTNRSA